ncbi:hypothetical protein [Aeromonas veronii]|uniref:hypothetical protein n=1 Tax=Aeromonas veronii TaxID=654 RepID=UPI001BCB5B9B|nr:hypothetical protein [Aeromonas veronii]MBS4704715.1 hypothetical protein [Aeromonas veronii]
MTLQVIIKATDIYGQRANPTALELASSLTFAHRIINKALAERMEDNNIEKYGNSTLNSEPALVNLHIAEVHNGSVILNGIIEATQNPFVQGVAGGIIANIITPGITAIARRTKRVFMRPERASVGRTLTVTIVSEKVVLHTHCRYEEHQRTEIVIHEENR